MSAYADTGFVVSLYKIESTSARAAEAMQQLVAPVWISQLGELEIRNAFQLAVFRQEIHPAAAAAKKSLFAGDLTAGVFVVRQVPASSLFALAIELAERYSAKFGTRSLDLIHVAAALHLGTKRFLSFDERQCQAARAEGLEIAV